MLNKEQFLINENHVSFDASIAGRLQSQYCEKHRLPMFAPLNGFCPNCYRNIYTMQPGGTGITVQDAASKLITGCPHCNYSFCE